MNGLTLPEVPEPERTSLKQVQVSPTMDTHTTDGRDFVPRTLRVVAFVSAMGALLIAGTKHYELVVPFLTGVALGSILLAGFEYVVRKAFATETILAQKGIVLPGDDTSENGAAKKTTKKFGGKAAIWLFALIKYPAVALLIWWITRAWSQTQIITFISGFILLQMIIGLRGLGGFLYPQTKRK